MAEAGIPTLALTDHDTLAGLPEAREEARRRGVELISGAEISAEWGGQDDIHIVALFVDERNARFNAALAERQEERRTRGERMAKKLVEAGYAIDLEAIRADVGDGVWGRPHLARALIRAGYAANNDEAFDRFLGREHPWYVPYEKWKAEDVVAAIASAGGISSLAHAVWYKDTDRLIRELAGTGLDALGSPPGPIPRSKSACRRWRASSRSGRPPAATSTARRRGESGPGESSATKPCWSACGRVGTSDNFRF
jgi:predicted metal-dependent phosphoesterase TrpH